MNKFKSKVQHNNDNNNGVPGAAGGSEKLDSSNPISTHSGTGEKETLNINVVGKKRRGTYSMNLNKNGKCKNGGTVRKHIAANNSALFLNWCENMKLRTSRRMNIINTYEHS